jgi:hypothetical protein
MGCECAAIHIGVQLDRHGDERQERDDKLLEELREEIRKLLEQEKYSHISPQMF